MKTIKKYWPPTISVHFEDLETLLMTSKNVHCSMHMICLCPSCLNRAHRIFIYFVPQKITPLSAPPLLAPRGICRSAPTGRHWTCCIRIILCVTVKDSDAWTCIQITETRSGQICCVSTVAIYLETSSQSYLQPGKCLGQIVEIVHQTALRITFLATICRVENKVARFCIHGVCIH